MSYKTGFVYSVSFGGPYGSDEYGLCLYGDVSHPVAEFTMMAADAQHPDEACLSDHQKWSLWFRFQNFRPYGEVLSLFDAVADLVKPAGWVAADSIEGFPDTGCSVRYLTDTRDMQFWGKPEENFPEEPNAHGYNAAKGFCLVFEKMDNSPAFSDAEVQEIFSLADKAALLVFGQTLLPNASVVG